MQTFLASETFDTNSMKIKKKSVHLQNINNCEICVCDFNLHISTATVFLPSL